MRSIVQLQKDFFKTQKTKDVDYRVLHLKKLRNAIKKNENNIINALYLDFNKPEFETLTSEIAVVIEEINLHIRKLKKWAKPKHVFPHWANFISFDKIYREPYGTVLIISPWNYPFNLSINPLIGAISGGNTVVLKPSELTPNTSAVIHDIITSVFDTSYVQVVEGDASVARNLLDQKWDYIFFTGSPAIGKYVYQSAAKNLTPVTLELGGKSPVIVDETANLKIAAKRIVWGKFFNAGQTCIAPDYILIPDKIRDDFINALKNEIQFFYADESNMASIINHKNYKRLNSLLENQKIVVGGAVNEENNRIAPTIVLNPNLSDDIMQYEIFGPILPVLSYKSVDEMDDILSRNPNPLSFYIFSNDKKFQQYLIAKYSFGGGVINDVLVHFVNNRLPFGGVGNSGFGQYHGKYSFITFTRAKSIVRRTFFPDIKLRYLPVSEIKKRIIRFVFGL